MENNWTEIRKECELDTNGDYLIKKVVLEKSSPNKTKIERKVMIDYAIRIIGIISIFMPLFLFYKQQQAEGQKQDRLQRLNLYSTAIVDLHSFSKEKPFSQSYLPAHPKVLL